MDNFGESGRRVTTVTVMDDLDVALPNCVVCLMPLEPVEARTVDGGYWHCQACGFVALAMPTWPTCDE